MTETKKTCDTCGGSGEIGYFQGESRFFITREECPACCGCGSVLEEDAPPGTATDLPTAGNENKRNGENQ